MLIAIHGVKLYLNVIQGGKLYAHCYTWIKAVRSFLDMN